MAMKMMVKDNDEDEWIKAAMNDDSMVAELLLRFKMSNASQPERSVPPTKLLSGWGFRRPRSAMRNNDVDLLKKDGETMRCSPVTPFSWSEEGTTGGGGSPSTTADGCETSSQFYNSSPTARSKGAVQNEAASSSGKKSGKIKTFAELKEEENILLKERLCLNKELTTLRATFIDEKSRNESFKRLKVEHNLQDTRRAWAASHSNYTHQTPLSLPEHAPSDKAPQPGYYEQKASHWNYSHQKPFIWPKHEPSYKAPQRGFSEHKGSHSNYTHHTPLVLPASCEHKASHSTDTNQTPLVLPKHAPSEKVTQPDCYRHKAPRSNYTHQTPLVLPNHALSDTAPQTDSLKVQNSKPAQERNFIMLDLNMVPPPEDGSSSDT